MEKNNKTRGSGIEPEISSLVVPRQAKRAIHAKHTRDHLLACIQARDEAAEARKYQLRVVTPAEAHEKEQQKDSNRRITYQRVMEKLDQSMFRTAQQRTALRVEAWKNCFCKKHRLNEPIVPSGKTVDPRYRSRLIAEEDQRVAGPARKIQKRAPTKDGKGKFSFVFLRSFERLGDTRSLSGTVWTFRNISQRKIVRKIQSMFPLCTARLLRSKIRFWEKPSRRNLILIGIKSSMNRILFPKCSLSSFPPLGKNIFSLQISFLNRLALIMKLHFFFSFFWTGSS